ncbi:glycosyltransferase family 4 protein [Tengunoibacter tsumagoiensis]|uniref:Glycoside hydrolase n=1 Tax=Tengunoibacter tsumagoiensis TaxID=2014871 RepID=A0A402A0I3_9CHLR|nr:glycosyltransferase family 4 protein [Tengunoibacter tsumagoiensis]GCE12623.1 glycoside hydrolase [Tengunoibacter tsumagoiensis]
MKILMLAPQPFLEERGAPFAVYHHIKALISMGFEIDLVTYHLGKPVNLPGLRIIRIPSLPGIKSVKVGPSLAKIPLDLLLCIVALWCLCSKRYSYIHTHEEAGVLGMILGSLFGLKHLYYMHSDLSQQIVSSEFTTNPLLIQLVKFVQKLMVRHADAVIAICPDIETSARQMSPSTPIYMIENSAVDENLPVPHPREVAQLRYELNLGSGPVLLYTGTLESYQGIDMLLHSIPTVLSTQPDAQYLLVGGQPEQVEKFTRMAQELGISHAVTFTGQRPLAEMPLYMAVADILLSPRSKGTNTPLKLYTYLRAGKPILATAIFSQTQVLSLETAMLVPPTAEGIAQGTLKLLQHPQWAATLGVHAQHFAESHYSWPVFLEKSTQVQREFAAEALTRETTEERAKDLSCVA